MLNRIEKDFVEKRIMFLICVIIFDDIWTDWFQLTGFHWFGTKKVNWISFRSKCIFVYMRAI